MFGYCSLSLSVYRHMLTITTLDQPKFIQPKTVLRPRQLVITFHKCQLFQFLFGRRSHLGILGGKTREIVRCGNRWEDSREPSIWFVVVQQNSQMIVVLGGGFKDFLFSPWKLGKISSLTRIFQVGWKHQPVVAGTLTIWGRCLLWFSLVLGKIS